MDNKTLRKSANTLFGILLVVIISIGIFIVLYNYLNWNANNSNINLGDNYSNSLNSLNNATDRLNSNVKDIQEGLKKVQEPQEGIFNVLAGLKGLASVGLIPLSMIDITTQSYLAFRSIVETNTHIPSFILDLSTTLILIFTIFVLWSVLRGEQQKLT